MFIQLNIKSKLFELVYSTIKNVVNLQTYRNRTIILIDICIDYKKRTEFPKEHFNLDCSYTVHFMFPKLFKNYVLFKKK